MVLRPWDDGKVLVRALLLTSWGVCIGGQWQGNEQGPDHQETYKACDDPPVHEY